MLKSPTIQTIQNQSQPFFGEDAWDISKGEFGTLDRTGQITQNLSPDKMRARYSTGNSLSSPLSSPKSSLLSQDSPRSLGLTLDTGFLSDDPKFFNEAAPWLPTSAQASAFQKYEARKLSTKRPSKLGLLTPEPLEIPKCVVIAAPAGKNLIADSAPASLARKKRDSDFFASPTSVSALRDPPHTAASSPFVRRTSLTTSYATPLSQVPLSPQLPSSTAQKDQRSYSNGAIDSSQKPKNSGTAREWVETQTTVARQGGPAHPELYIDSPLLEKKARSVAVFLAQQPKSGYLLDWLLKKYESPDDLIKAAGKAFIEVHFSQEVDLLLDHLIQYLDKKLRKNTYKNDAAYIRNPIQTLCQELHDQITQYRVSLPINAFETMDLRREGETFISAHERLRQYQEKVIQTGHDVLACTEGLILYLEQSDSFQVSEEKKPQLVLRLFAGLLFDSLQENQKANQDLSALSEDSLAVKAAVETQQHLKCSHKIATLLEIQPSFDSSSRSLQTTISSVSASSRRSSLSEDLEDLQSISRRDIIEMLRIGLPIDTEDTEGNSLLQIALKHQNYDAAISLFLQNADLSHRNHQFEPIALNQIQISKQAIQKALLESTETKAPDFLNADLISMGEFMQFMLNQPEDFKDQQSLRTLIALNLNLDIQANEYGHGELYSPDKICEEIKAWCLKMIQLKLGASPQGFGFSALLLTHLIKIGLDQIDTPEGVALLDQLFSMDSVSDIAAGQHNDATLTARLHRTFFAKLATHSVGEISPKIGRRRISVEALQLETQLPEEARAVLQNPTAQTNFPTDFRVTLDHVLSTYRQSHSFLLFKKNYRHTLKLLKNTSQEQDLGEILALFHGQSGGWDQHSFKRLLAHSLGIPGLNTLESHQSIDTNTALTYVNQWAFQQLKQKILGPEADQPDLERSRDFLKILMDKGIDYFAKTNGSSKAKAILNPLYQIDTKDLHRLPNLQDINQQVLKRLSAQLSVNHGVHNTSAQPALARAFSQPRFFKTSCTGQALADIAQSVQIAAEIAA